LSGLSIGIQGFPGSAKKIFSNFSKGVACKNWSKVKNYTVSQPFEGLSWCPLAHR